MQQIKAKANAEHLFVDKNLDHVYRKVDYLYQKRLNEENID